MNQQWSGQPADAGQPPPDQFGSGRPGLPPRPAWDGLTPPPPAPPPAERVRIAWSRRADSDYIFSYWTALGWTVLTLGFYGLYVIYQLVRRMRDHNARRLELLDAGIAFGWEEAGRQGLQQELSPSFERAAGHLAVLRQMTGDFRDPLVWTILALVGRGIVDLVAFVLLDQDLVKHDTAEGGVEHELSLIYSRLGRPVPAPDPARIKGQHNYVGRIIATVFSLGIYEFWWFYNVMEEPNRHFHINWVQEDALAAAVENLSQT